MIVIKYVYFGLLFVFLGIIGVCVFFLYLVKKLLKRMIGAKWKKGNRIEV